MSPIVPTSRLVPTPIRPNPPGRCQPAVLLRARRIRLVRPTAPPPPRRQVSAACHRRRTSPSQRRRNSPNCAADSGCRISPRPAGPNGTAAAGWSQRLDPPSGLRSTISPGMATVTVASSATARDESRAPDGSRPTIGNRGRAGSQGRPGRLSAAERQGSAGRLSAVRRRRPRACRHRGGRSAISRPAGMERGLPRRTGGPREQAPARQQARSPAREARVRELEARRPRERARARGAPARAQAQARIAGQAPVPGSVRRSPNRPGGSRRTTRRRRRSCAGCTAVTCRAPRVSGYGTQRPPRD